MMQISADHPALPGHFPGHPVVPGVVLLEAVVHALAVHAGQAVRVTSFPAIKFLAPLGPEQEFNVHFSIRQPGQAGFEITTEGEKLASGSVSYEMT